MKDKQNQQNNTNDKGVKYKCVPFNMTLAKLISDGSVDGKIYVLWNTIKCNVVTYVEPLENGNAVFEVILPSPYGCTNVTFDKDGTSVQDLENYSLTLHIDIPAEDSCDNDIDEAVNYLATQQLAMLQKDPHYHKCKIEPIEYILANNLGFCEGNVVKYITRYKDKGGVDDLRKIKVYVDYLIKELTEQNK